MAARDTSTRVCLDCDSSLESPRHRRCASCQKRRKRAKDRERYCENRKNPEYVAKRALQQRERHHWRMENDPEYRQRVKDSGRDAYRRVCSDPERLEDRRRKSREAQRLRRLDPATRQRDQEAKRQRYREDDEYRASQLLHARDQWQKIKASPDALRSRSEDYKHRYESDPEFRADAIARAKKRAQDPDAMRDRQARMPIYQEVSQANRRQRYRDDPEYRERVLEYGRLRGGLRKYVQPLLERDGWICAWCRQFLDDPFDGSKTHVDHVRPRSKGGTEDLGNLQLLHAGCNLRKSNRM